MTAHPGSFCPDGAEDVSKNGVAMKCSRTKPGERSRWRRKFPAEPKTPRGRGRGNGRGSRGTTLLPQVNTGIDPTKLPEAPVPAPATPPTAEQTTPPAEQATDRPTRRIDTNRHLDQPLMPNTWGGTREPGAVTYHGDGPTGTALDDLGRDARIDVDGEPLGDVIGKLATQVVAGQMHPADLPVRLGKIRDRLPEDSRAGRVMSRLIDDVDHRMTPAPALPASTPPAMRDLAAALHTVPICRKNPKEIDRIKDLAEKFEAGQIGGGMLVRQLRDVANMRHEMNSDAGKIYIDQTVIDATKNLEAWFREDPSRRTRQQS